MLSAILALSLMFASCDNPSDTNSDNGGDSTNSGVTGNNGNNTSLGNGNNNGSNSSSNSNNSNSSGNGGNSNNSSNSNGNNNDNSNSNSGDNNNNNSGNAENLIKKTIRLVSENDSDCYLELKTDGTALLYYNDEDIPTLEFKYTYNEKEIYMKLEKYCNDGFWGDDYLLTYDELRSKVNEYFSVENIKQVFKAEYEELQEDERFKEEYPDGISYEKWEREAIDWMGFKTLDEYVEYFRQMYEGIYKAIFGAQITYAYEINDGKMMLTEKFTGVKNLLNSECRFSDGTDYLGIYCYAAYLHFGDDDGDSIAYLGTDNKTINFSAKNITATYTENLAKETVTMSFNGKDYICEFYGRIFTQTE